VKDIYRSHTRWRAGIGTGAALIGLVEASRNYNPQRGPFGPYAKPWCKGEITALFKEVKRHRAESLDAPLPNDRRDEPDKPRTLADKLAYAAPVGAIDLRGLADVDRKIIQARDAGESLVEVGKAHGLSPERIRQREARARTRLKGMAAICLSDLTCRGEILPFPRRYSWGDTAFAIRLHLSRSTASHSSQSSWGITAFTLLHSLHYAEILLLGILAAFTAALSFMIGGASEDSLLRRRSPAHRVPANSR
jgi:RNA polymerase sigma factor (sigma-70 family)